MAMETKRMKQRAVHWSDGDTFQLIKARKELKNVFTGKPNAAKRGYEAMCSKLGDKFTLQQVKRKWENLVQKYKDLKYPPTGLSTEGGQDTAESWIFYKEIDDYMSPLDIMAPPLVIDTSSENLMLTSAKKSDDAKHTAQCSLTSSAENHSPTTGSPKKLVTFTVKKTNGQLIATPRGGKPLTLVPLIDEGTNRMADISVKKVAIKKDDVPPTSGHTSKKQLKRKMKKNSNTEEMPKKKKVGTAEIFALMEKFTTSSAERSASFMTAITAIGNKFTSR